MRYLFIFPLLGLALGQGSPSALVNLVDTLKTSSLETILVDLIDAAGLTEALSQGGPFTIFAPDNHAFNLLGNDTLNSLKADPAKLADILKYHVVSGLYHVKPDLLVNELMLDSLKGDKLRVNYYYAARHALTVEGARITYPDKMASNGIIHRIEKVLLPPVGNIVEVLTQDGSFNTLIAAAKAAGLVEALSDGPITLMAPTDAAFSRLGNDTVNKLLQNPQLLGDVLKYHILHGTLYSKGMHSGSFHTLEEADRLRIYQSFFGSVIVGGHRVTKPDMSATNGVVHKLDYVLVPSSLSTQIKNL
ncbi:transforming growth factor-beta-induced protein ig-h3-like [Saccostrea echinata]|uniref:transforming growth factor-beta-induced protein ig-h3-like n=1 Tax=Saccostrea echinata TaxID=191078 RepID=UPI002A81AC1F|nr:transforming growth factor-beta-induced protein ig-h3-like [Saccostrea echinata]